MRASGGSAFDLPVSPELLNSVMVSFIILVSALGVSLLVAAVTRRLRG